MLDNRPFHLRRFSIYHHRSTMKAGTDSVILGAWVDTKDVKTALDVGAGCGILALMMAQRSQAEIHAIEIDAASAEEAALNFKTSPWHERLKVYHANFIEFPAMVSCKYDLIISNPPFFTSTFKTKQFRRNLARHTDSLSFKNLIENTGLILSAHGRLAVVLPIPESKAFIKLAEKYQLYPHRMLEIVPVKGREANRINMEFGFEKPDILERKTFILREPDQSFTKAYKDFLGDYYLGL